MKKTITAIGITLIFTPLLSFAAMPNFIGTGYKTVEKCSFPPDHAIADIINGKEEITGCTPQADWDREQKRGWDRFNKPQTVYPAGTIFTDKEGNIVDYCPRWYFMGCVITND